MGLTKPKDQAPIRKVSARALWIRLLTARVEVGEPYIVFSDQPNRAIPEHLSLPVFSKDIKSVLRSRFPPALII